MLAYNTAIPFQQAIASRDKAYRVHGYGDNYFPLTYGPTRDKARANFFKANRHDFDQDFIGFCRDFKVLREPASDRFIFSPPAPLSPLSSDAKALLTTGCSSLSHRRSVDNGITVFNNIANLLQYPLNELLSQGLLDEGIPGVHFTRYPLTQKGLQLRLALLSAIKPLSGRDIEWLTCEPHYRHGDERIDMYNLKDLECLVPYPVMLDSLPDVNVFIHSGEWGAYWREDGAGYSNKKENAGVYTFKEAYDTTHHCGPEKGINFILIGAQSKAA